MKQFNKKRKQKEVNEFKKKGIFLFLQNLALFDIDFISCETSFNEKRHA